MNVLPFVFTLLMVIGMMAISDFNRTLVLSKECAVYQAHLKGIWYIDHQLQKRLYRKIGGKELEEEDKIYFRDEWIGSQASCLNLFSLIDENQRDQPLFQVAHRYLTKLYSPLLPEKEKEKSAYMKKVLNSLLDAEQEAMLNEKSAQSLAKLALPDKKLRWVYYKMLRGTLPYDLSQGNGYPPLEEVVIFRKTKQNPLPFNYAHPFLLEQVLGEEVVAKVIEREKELVFNKKKKKEVLRNTPLSKDELKEVISELSAQLKPEELTLLSYERSRNKPPIFWIDQATHVAMRYFPDENNHSQKEKKSGSGD